MTLEEAVGQALALTASQEPDSDELMATAQAILQQAKRATPEAVAAALQRLIPTLDHSHPQIAGLMAITGGAMVESGAEPGTFGSAVLDRLPEIFTSAHRFVTTALASLPEKNEEDEANSEGGMWFGDRHVPDEVVQKVLARDQEAVSAFLSLEQWCLPAIACLGKDKQLRDQNNSNEDVRAAVRPVLAYHAVAHALWKMLHLLDDESILVLHPATKQAFVCRIGGIADNFQLHTLLADALIAEAPRSGFLDRWRGKSERPATEGMLPGQRPDPAVAANARGEGPQQIKKSAHGVWNMYQWTAVGAEGKLPDPSIMPPTIATENDYWIWGEGMPANIARYPGKGRIVLLGPASYQRDWSACRFFDIPAYVRVEGTLTEEQFEMWMTRLATTPHPEED